MDANTVIIIVLLTSVSVMFGAMWFDQRQRLAEKKIKQLEKEFVEFKRAEKI